MRKVEARTKKIECTSVTSIDNIYPHDFRHGEDTKEKEKWF